MKNKNDKTKAMFIKTKDLETSENLKKEGFDLIDYSNGVWTFVNCTNSNKKFSEDVNKKIVYSNMLCF